VVPRVSAIAAALRGAGGTVAWVLPGAGQPAAVSDEFLGPEIAATYRASGGDGPLRDRFWHELAVADEDMMVEKTAPSAFFPGRRGARAHRGPLTTENFISPRVVCRGRGKISCIPW
jgi:ureidoacrylate peracid hydrolase